MKFHNGNRGTLFSCEVYKIHVYVEGKIKKKITKKI